MNGWDFSILWAAGQAILHGQDPYGVAHFFYPLPFAYALAGLAWLPLPVAYYLWLAINLGLLVAFFRRRFWQWLLYVPIMHLFSSGQVGFAWWCMERGVGRHWRGAALAALMTFKPEMALWLLAWHLWDWLQHDRRTLLRWAGLTILLWGIPCIWRPGWIADWLHAAPAYGLLSASNAPGIFSLVRLWPAIWPLLAIVALAILVWGIRQREESVRAATMLATPLGLFYSTMALLDCAPAWLLTPASLLAAGLSLLTSTFIPFMILPLVVIAWHWQGNRSLVRAVEYVRRYACRVRHDNCPRHIPVSEKRQP